VSRSVHRWDYSSAAAQDGVVALGIQWVRLKLNLAVASELHSGPASASETYSLDIDHAELLERLGASKARRTAGSVAWTGVAWTAVRYNLVRLVGVEAIETAVAASFATGPYVAARDIATFAGAAAAAVTDGAGAKLVAAVLDFDD
jgi:hypothetical protein